MEFSHILSVQEGNTDASSISLIDDTGFENIKKKVNIDTQAISDALSECLSLENGVKQEENAGVQEEGTDVERKEQGMESIKQENAEKRTIDSHQSVVPEQEREEEEGRDKSANSKQKHNTDPSGRNSQLNNADCANNSLSSGSDSNVSGDVTNVSEETSDDVGRETASNQNHEEEEEEEEDSLLGDQGGMSVDLLRFLLPGLCHLTSEDEPRQILVDNELLPMLNYYLKHMLKRHFVDDTNDNVIVRIFSIL
jgi:hypothetical protein